MKTKLLLTLFILTVFTALLNAQQYWQPMYNINGWQPGYAGVNAVYVDHAGNVYVEGMEDNISILGDTYSSIWEWNGSNWSRLNNGSGINSFDYGAAAFICGDLYNNIYAICSNSVSMWNGSSWSLLDNSPWFYTGIIRAINTDQYNNIYAAVALDSVANGIGFEVYEWNGSSWAQLGAGLQALENPQLDDQGITCICADKYGNVYVGGTVTSEPSSNLGNIMVWNGSTWNPAMYNNALIYANGHINSLCADTSGNVYAAGDFSYSGEGADVPMMQWNGATWVVITGLLPFGSSQALCACVDGTGKLYASTGTGVFTWNGSNWSAIGDLSSYSQNQCYINGDILQLAAGSNGALYTGPSFLDLNKQLFMLQYNTLSSGEVLAYIETTGSVTCSVPGAISVNAYGGTPPYQYLWSNGQSGTNTITVFNDSIYTVTITDAQSNQTTAEAYVCNETDNTISGIVFEDLNNNCIYDAGDILLPNIQVNFRFADSALAIGISGINGYALASIDTGTFAVSVSAFNTTCTSFNVCYVNGDSTGHLSLPCDTLSNFNIALTNYVTKPDLTMHVGWTASNPGFSKQYWVMPYNLSNNSSPDSVTIVFNYDPALVYDSAQYPLPAADVNAHTLTWMVPGYNIPYYTWNWLFGRFNCFFTVPANINPTYVLQSTFTIEPVSTDCDSTNNTIYLTQVVTGSHDPNEKDVYPSGGLGDADTVLTYTIYYQNTGTDSTHFIAVVDTLSSDLEPNTVVNLASSDNYSNFTIYGNILTWTFNPLQLPDSSVNNSGSKGFITFSVNREDNLSPGTQIANRAAIQFDYNTNVYTNTVTSTIGIDAGLSRVINNISVQAFPNPFDDVTHIVVNGIADKFDFNLYDVTGRLQLKLSPPSAKFDVARNQLAPGVYLYDISVADNVVSRGKLVVK